MHDAFDELGSWLQTKADPHAAHRYIIWSHAKSLLGNGDGSPTHEHREVATALERWRYQELNEHRGSLTSDIWRRAETLDLVASRLLGHPPRLTRNARAAVAGGPDPEAPVCAALECLDSRLPLAEVERRAAEITARHFRVHNSHPQVEGLRRMLLYAPLYLSSYCINHCLYCGFRFPDDAERAHLTIDQSLSQADILWERGFRHLLLVAGDYPSLTRTEYFTAILHALRDRGATLAVEIAPQTTTSYAAMAAAGAWGVTLYQETYDETLYAKFHPRGSKTSYDWRLEGLERAAEAGVRRLGLGILLGLADPRQDLVALIRHGAYLQSRFPHCSLAFSLPRIHQAPFGFTVPVPVDDELFVRMYCALRAAFPRAELTLSTRERPELRNRLVQVCISQMSAGSSTAPGGYCADESQLPIDGQFPVSDHRTAAEVAGWLKSVGLAPVWEVC